MVEGRRLLIDVDDGMRIFRSALRSLLPSIEAAQIAWREPDNYDDWDDIAAVLFRSYVSNAIGYTVEGHSYYPISEYGLIRSSYAFHSFLMREPVEDSMEIFVRLETDKEPFDMAAFVRVDAAFNATVTKTRVPFFSTKFAVRLRSAREETTLRYLKIASKQREC